MSRSAIALAFTVVCFAAPAQSQSPESQFEEGRNLRVSGNYAGARQVLTALVRQSENNGAGGVFLGAVLDELGRTEQDLGNFAEAERLLARALSLFQKAGDSAAHAMAGEHLGEVYLEQGRAPEASVLFRHALEFHNTATPPDPERVAVDMVDLAMAQGNLAKWDKAEELLRQALALLEEKLGPDDPMLATALGPLGATLTRHGHYREALAATERSWRILSRDPRVPDPDLLNTMTTLGYLYSLTGQSREAELYARMAIAKAEAIYGPEHPRLGWQLTNCAAILKRIGLKQEASDMQARAHAILARSRQANPSRVVNANALR